jgi:hypothetical protein
MVTADLLLCKLDWQVYPEAAIPHKTGRMTDGTACASVF